MSNNATTTGYGATGAGTIGAVGTAPLTNAGTGTTWLNTSTGNVSVNNGTSWVTVGGTGGGGGAGSVYFTGSTGPTYSPSYQTDYDIVLKRPGKPDLKVGEALDLIMSRLSILTPDLEKLEKYAALKKAYDHYKLIESLIQEENKDGK